MTDDTLDALNPNPAPVPDAKAEDPDKKRAKDFRARIDACKQYRRKLIANWVTNINFRRGKPFASQTDEDRIAVNLDWSLTKAKQASLFSQVPEVHVDHAPQSLMVQGDWLYAFEQRLNDTLVLGGIETAMDEVLPDVINAAGIGAVLVAHEAITSQVQIPQQDPMNASLAPPTDPSLGVAGPPVMATMPRVEDHRYTITRISPSDLLWPINFTGADFDNAPWIGRSGRLSWAQAQMEFGLTEDDKSKVLGTDAKPLQDRLTHDLDKDKLGVDDDVVYDEIFYKEFYYDASAKSYVTIHRMVFVAGKQDPVVDEAWNGQRVNADNSVYGARKFPIRVLTLTYITDDTIPPSDTAIGRSQVNEINKSRTQMIMQRERSLPVRWFDVNRVDPVIQTSLMRGTWQGMIPVQGRGDAIIGEIARAGMPQEDFTFDQIAKSDLNESWQLGPNQEGNFASGRQSAKEAGVVQDNFQTRIGRERAKVAKFFVSVSEVLGGLLSIYEDPQSFGQGFDPAVSKTLGYSILADSTVLVDSNQRLARLKDFINFTAKSGWVNIGVVLKEIALLSGLDPNAVITPPQPPPPAEPNISLRLTGTEDMLNPLTLAIMIKSGQAPSSDLIEQAKALIAQAVTPPGMQPGQGPEMSPIGPNGQPLPPGTSPLPPPSPVPQGSPLPNVHTPAPPPPPVGEANPQMGLMPKINKRSDQNVK